MPQVWSPRGQKRAFEYLRESSTCVCLCLSANSSVAVSFIILLDCFCGHNYIHSYCCWQQYNNLCIFLPFFSFFLRRHNIWPRNILCFPACSICLSCPLFKTQVLVIVKQEPQKLNRCRLQTKTVLPPACTQKQWQQDNQGSSVLVHLLLLSCTVKRLFCLTVANMAALRGGLWIMRFIARSLKSWRCNFVYTLLWCFYTLSDILLLVLDEGWEWPGSVGSHVRAVLHAQPQSSLIVAD